MSNARKLQTEIDRVMKKVDEGVELFDEIWEKVYSAEQQSQKEKHEMDLKKEIKKLQRLRDQIKTWIGGSEVKDKDALVEARKLIETKMEQFKICEKETKTKTYSKEGLARAEKLDPAEEAKLATVGWIQDYIEKLQQVVEEADFEIEKLSSGKGKKTNKHKIESLQQHILNHRYHVSKLEGIIRLVNNDRLECEPVDALKDDFDYYLDSYEEDEYKSAYDQDEFYESLGLEELDVVNVDHVTQAAANATTNKIKGMDDAASSSSKGSKDRKASKKSSLSSVIPLTIGRARASSGKVEEVKPATPSKVSRSNSTASSQSNNGSGGGVAAVVAPPPPPPTTPGVPTPKTLAAAVGGGSPTFPAPTGTTGSPAPAPATSMAAILKRESEQQEKERQKLLREQQARAQAEQLRLQQQAQQQRQQQEAALRQQQQAEASQRLQEQEALKRQQAEKEAAAKQQQQQQAAVAAAAAAAAQLQVQHPVDQPKGASLAVQQQQQAPIQASLPPTTNSALDILASGLGGLGLSSGTSGSVLISSSDSQASIPTLPPPLGSLPGSTSSAGSTAVSSASVAGAAMEMGTTSYLSALSDSLASLPNAVDHDRTRQYTPQNPYPTPAAYPSTPSNIFSNPAVFEKLGTDCLFFIFYYAQGTYQQYLAARELKKQSWRFHKKYMTWFQRHEEPKITTDEYEQGTYLYFDYETGWCTRIKTDFRFEYSYLEDSLQ